MIDILYFLIYTTLSTILAEHALLPYISAVRGIEQPYLPTIFMLAVAVVLSVFTIVNNKKRIILGLSLVALGGGFFLATTREMRSEFLRGHDWLLSAFLLSVGIVVLNVLMQKVRKVKLGCGILVAGLLVSSYFLGIIDDKLGLLSASLLVLTIVFEEIRFRSRGGDALPDFVVRLFPFALVLSLAAFFIPGRDMPYDWPITRNIVGRISDTVTDIVQELSRKDSTEALDSQFGFSEDADISGNVGGKAVTVMTITAGRLAPEYAYLDGKYFDDFDGRKWNESICEYSYMLDTMQTACAISNVNMFRVSDYQRTCDIRIYFDNTTTKHVFTPVKSLISEVNYMETPVIYNLYEVLFEKRMGIGTTYTTKYYLINRNNELIHELIDAGLQLTKEDWELVCDQHNLRGPEYSYESFLAYKDLLYSGTLSPLSPAFTDLSEGVQAFLTAAIGDARTDYDKLVALSKAFADFEYTTQPGALPDYVDTPSAFLDYFILDSRRGHCNSFATAFVLLAQAEGIPARYVHGYRVPLFPSNTTTVTSAMAHAYPEAYVDGLGWLVFEPTPGIEITDTWEAKKKIDLSAYTKYTPPPTEPPHEDVLITNSTARIKEEIPWYKIALPILMLFVVLFVLLLVERIVNRRRFERLTREQAALVTCRQIMNLLRRLGYKKADPETIREFVFRLDSEAGLPLTAFSVIYEKLLYSSEPLNHGDMLKLDNEYEMIVKKLRGLNRLYYGFMHFIGLY